jgi:8-oxo-dGTP diphosphatase
VVAVGAVAVSEGALLLVRRANPPEAGRWTLPGGRVDVGETLAQAVTREAFEETGLAVRCQGLRGWAERITAGFHYVILDFDVEIVFDVDARSDADGRPSPAAGGDALEASWVPFEELGTTDLVSGLKDFLEEHGVVRGAESRQLG